MTTTNTPDGDELRQQIKSLLRLEKTPIGAHGPAAYKINATEEEKIDAILSWHQKQLDAAVRKAQIDELEMLPDVEQDYQIEDHIEQRLAQLRQQVEGDDEKK